MGGRAGCGLICWGCFPPERGPGGLNLGILGVFSAEIGDSDGFTFVNTPVNLLQTPCNPLQSLISLDY